MGKGKGKGKGQQAQAGEPATVSAGTAAATEEATSTTQLASRLEGLSVSSSSQAKGSADQPTRGGYRTSELRTLPANVKEVKATDTKGCRSVEVLANFIGITPMKTGEICKYRVDMEPDIEESGIRGALFKEASKGLFKFDAQFDGRHDARSPDKVCDKKLEKLVEARGVKAKVIIQRVGSITRDSFELVRLYNMHMNTFLNKMDYFRIGSAGDRVHKDIYKDITPELIMLRGFSTSTNIHQDRRFLMNLAEAHKLMQKLNVNQIIAKILTQCQNRRPPVDYREATKAALIGKLVVPGYTKKGRQLVYRIEDVNFSKNPTHTFVLKDDKGGREITYVKYMKEVYQKDVHDLQQPMLAAVPSNRRPGGVPETSDLVPELCNIAGLTDDQRRDPKLRWPMIQASQVHPRDRVQNMRDFLKKLHEKEEVIKTLTNWAYNYDKEPVSIKGRVLPTERIATGLTASLAPAKWVEIDSRTANFERQVLIGSIAVKPQQFKLAIIAPDCSDLSNMMSLLREGFGKVGLQANVNFLKMEQGETPREYIKFLNQVTPDTKATIVLIPRQIKTLYDAIKKVAAERAMITQVVTAQLLRDSKKNHGAASKIAIQVAAKVGGEPWHANIPLTNCMVCGYDTYHDTTKRGRSFGAFIASMNSKFSQWYSKADEHDRLEELSHHLATNMGVALKRYKEIHKKFPERVWLYRDGVSEGQLAQVYQTEMKNLLKVIKACDSKIKTTIVIVNKRIGARFYMKSRQDFDNCPPGTVIDDVVTRQERYDFYLISSSTRAGTVAPTYYNIIHDESSDLGPAFHHTWTYKLCLLYYNWTGSVRVPAPCQYAHKLAYLCGESLHSVPNAKLDDRLHFL